MLLARKTGWFSQAGVSVAGGVGHNVDSSSSPPLWWKIERSFITFPSFWQREARPEPL